MHKLSPHSVNTSSQYSVDVSTDLKDSSLIINFKVCTPRIISSSTFSQYNTDNCGLWDFDVVEAFLQKNGSDEYLELQVSPLNQRFALRVISPRIETIELKDFNFKSATNITDYGFNASIEVDIDLIPGNAKPIRGNLFACLGPDDSRQYFGLNLDSQGGPDFHRPELFVADLLELT